MILRGFKNFLKSIKCYFTPLGLITIFTTIALTISLTGIFSSVRDLFVQLGETIGKTSIDWGEAGSSIISSVEEANYNISSILNLDWVMNTITKALIDSGLGETVSNATEAIKACAGKVITYLIVFVIIMLIGIVVGYVFLSVQVRYAIIKDKWWKVLLCCLLDAIVQLVVILIIVGLIILWAPFIFIAPLLMLVITEILSILGAYFIHAFKKVKFKEIFSFKTIALCTLTDFILFVSGIGLVILITFVFQTVVAIVIGLPLFEILLIVSRLTAETFVVDKMQDSKQIEVIEKNLKA